MNKIKNFLSDNKEEMKVVAYGIGMLAAGFYFGKKFEEIGVAVGLRKLAMNGKKLYTVMDNEVYVMSIVKEQINKD